jgi:hypothetical protein
MLHINQARCHSSFEFYGLSIEYDKRMAEKLDVRQDFVAWFSK